LSPNRETHKSEAAQHYMHHNALKRLDGGRGWTTGSRQWCNFLALAVLHYSLLNKVTFLTLQDMLNCLWPAVS